MVFFNAVTGVLTVFLIGYVGFFLAQKGFVEAGTKRFLPMLITRVVLPPYLLRNVTTTFGGEQFSQLLSGALIPLVSIFGTFVLALFLGKVLGMGKERQAVFSTAFASSNNMFIGLPINLALFGETAIPYVLLYFFGNAVFFWTVGCYTIARAGSQGDTRLVSMQTLKQIFSPPLLGFLCGVLLVFFDIQIPVFIDNTFKYVGDMAVGLAVIYIGMAIQEIDLKSLHLDRDIFLVFIGRFVLSPMSIVALAWCIPIPPLMRDVFIIQSSLPVMLNVAILAAYYKADAQYASVVTGFSTLLGMLTVPLYMLLISYFA